MTSVSNASRLAQQLEAQHQSLLELVHGRTEEDLLRQGPNGAWSAHDHLAHLGRFHEVMLLRLDQIRDENRPAFEPYRAERDPAWPGWQGLETSAIMEKLAELRRALIDRVASMSPVEAERIGIHQVFGLLPVRLWIEFFLAHEGHHHYVLFRRARGG
jgi:hypothetical protein